MKIYITNSTYNEKNNISTIIFETYTIELETVWTL